MVIRARAVTIVPASRGTCIQLRMRFLKSNDISALEIFPRVLQSSAE